MSVSQVVLVGVACFDAGAAAVLLWWRRSLRKRDRMLAAAARERELLEVELVRGWAGLNGPRE